MGFRDRFRTANSWYKNGVELTQESRYEEDWNVLTGL